MRNSSEQPRIADRTSSVGKVQCCRFGRFSPSATPRPIPRNAAMSVRLLKYAKTRICCEVQRINASSSVRIANVANAIRSEIDRVSELDSFHLREVHADQARAARFLHRHAVEHVRGFHRPAGVRDHDELCVARHVAHQAHESIVVDLIERRVDFVENAEWTRFVAKDREEQCQRGEGAFAAGKQRDRLILFSRRLGDQLDAALEYVFFIEELHSCLSDAEDRREYISESLIDGGEGVTEYLA